MVIVCLGGGCSRGGVPAIGYPPSLCRRRPAFWLKRRDTNTHTNTHTYTHLRGQRPALCQCYGGGPGAPPVINNGNCAKLSLGGNVRPVRSRTLRPFRTCGFYCLRCHAARSLSITIVSGDSRQPPGFRGYVRFARIRESLEECATVTVKCIIINV